MYSCCSMNYPCAASQILIDVNIFKLTLEELYNFLPPNYAISSSLLLLHPSSSKNPSSTYSFCSSKMYTFLFALKLTSGPLLERRTAGYTTTDYKTNTQITKELKITPILDKLLVYNSNWIQHVNRMPRNRLPRLMKH